MNNKNTQNHSNLSLSAHPRPKERIPELLKFLESYWLQHPDLRLGQIISNAARTHCPEVFYIEDDKLFLALQNLNTSESSTPNQDNRSSNIP